MTRKILRKYIILLRGMRIGSTLWWMGELLVRRKTLVTQIHMRSLSTGRIDYMKYCRYDATGLLSHSNVYLMSYVTYRIMMI